MAGLARLRTVRPVPAGQVRVYRLSATELDLDPSSPIQRLSTMASISHALCTSTVCQTWVGTLR